jgi:hypothetical protein
LWALNSAVECHPHTVEVIGSNPIAPTIFGTAYEPCHPSDNPIADNPSATLPVNNQFAYVSASRAQQDAQATQMTEANFPCGLRRESSQPTATVIEQDLAATKTESV